MLRAWRGPCSITLMRSSRAGPGAGAPLTVKTRSAEAAGAPVSAMMIVDNVSSPT